jgi:hypothetical protein
VNRLLLEIYLWLTTRRWFGLLVLVILVLLALLAFAGFVSCRARNLPDYACGLGG